jgi:outer membrane protein TolC
MILRTVTVTKNKLLIVFFCLLNFSSIHGQNEGEWLLTEREFLRQVLLYHPSLVSEELEVERAKQRVQVARAKFDPEFMAEWMTKNFDDKQYYDYQNGALSWQAPPGIKVRAGMERNRGDFVNPEFNTPSEGLVFAEVAVPLGDGLFRTADQTRLQKARVDANRAVSQLELSSRNVVMSAADLYWNWVATQKDLELRQEISELAVLRYGQIQNRFRQGLATGMDTLEAYTLYLQRETERLSTEQLLERWLQGAGTMIWDESLFSAYRNARVVIDTNWTSGIDVVTTARRSPLINPIMEIANFQLQSAQLDRLLARERLKPDVFLKGKALSTRGAPIELSGNSAVLGVSAYLPILSRRERAEWKLTNLRLEQLEVSISARERDLMQLYEQLSNQLKLIKEQERILSENVANAFELLQMENKLLLFGESTLILVNLRETNYINFKLRYIDVQRRKKLIEWRLALLTYSPEELLLD